VHLPAAAAAANDVDQNGALAALLRSLYDTGVAHPIVIIIIMK
jgi:hypothetical protein